MFILENKKTEMPLPLAVIKLAKLYYDAGFQLVAVGGCVRDFLMHVEPKDYDLATDATFEDSKKILKNFKLDETGKAFSVIRVYMDGEEFEIAQYRKDISHNRNGKSDDIKVDTDNVSLQKDLERRDLTINNIAYDPIKKELIHIGTSLSDLENKIIRFVGSDKKMRIIEDRLRILRLFRQKVKTGFKIEQETSDAIKHDKRLRNISISEDLSQERITEEVFKTIEIAKKANKPEILEEYFSLLFEYEMWEEMFPKMKITPIHNLKTLNAAIIFAMLFETNENMSKYLVLDLKFPERITNQICFLINFKNKIDDDSNAFRLLIEKERYHISNDLIEEYTNVLHLNKQKVNKFLKYSDIGITTSGDDLLSQGFKGADLGKEKERRELEIYNNL
jgi:tRNA nucleotidyltransferase/poly(A) polymerase